MRDIDIRQALRREMGRLHRDQPDTRIVEELGLCQGVARVDIAAVNGNIHGYEIKSECDTLARLRGQVAVYDATLDFITIVVAACHARKVVDIVPPWWGIWTVTGTERNPRLEASRDANRNPDLEPFKFAQLLWRDEALQALTEYGLANGMRSKPRQSLWERLATDLTKEQLGQVVRSRLKCRPASWRPPVQPV